MTTLVVGKGAPTKPRQADPRNLGDIGLAAWLDFELARCDIAEIVQRLQTLEMRLTNAADWFEQHPPGHPRYTEAYSLKLKLENDEESEQGALAMNRKRAWHHLINVYLAMTQQDAAGRDEWIGTQLPQAARVYAHRSVSEGHPAALWRGLMGYDPPGEFPESARANWVGWRLGAVPVWASDELREALEKRRQR